MISPAKIQRLILFIIFVHARSTLGIFEADVRWTCSDEFVSIFVRTPLPFEGIVRAHSPNVTHTSSVQFPEICTVQGFGTNVAVLKLKLNSPECGMIYEPISKTHHLLVDIQSHPVLIVEGDKSVNITCRDVANDTFWSNQNDAPLPSDYQIRILSSRLPVESVKYSQPYTIQVRTIPKRSKTAEFFVGQCQAQPIGGNVTVQLTDSVGCALFKSIMSDFSRRESVEEAEIPSMFRFPDAKQLKISCVVTECEGHCEKRSCEADSSASSLLERTTASLESEDVQKTWIVVNIQDEKDVLTLSVTAQSMDDVVSHTETVTDANTPPSNLILSRDNTETEKENLKKNREDSVSGRLTTTECVTEYEFTVLYYLCIFLAVCSIVGFTMNIVLCIMLKRRSKKAKNTRRMPFPVEQIHIPKSKSVRQDFWINDAEEPREPTYFPQRQDSISSYSSKPSRRPIPSEYGIPTVVPPPRSTTTSSSDDRSSSDIYRRPNQINGNRSDARHSNSTFMTHSTTMETDVDSQASSANQATSYH